MGAFANAADYRRERQHRNWAACAQLKGAILPNFRPPVRRLSADHPPARASSATGVGALPGVGEEVRAGQLRVGKTVQPKESHLFGKGSVDGR